MKPHRVSVTDLNNSADYFRDKLSLEQLIERLERRGPQSAAMKCGSAFHQVLYKYGVGVHAQSHFQWDGFTFMVDGQVDIPLGPHDRREIKVTQEYPGALLVGVIDVISADGITLTDWKLSGYPQVEKFASAWQWRAYMDMVPSARHFVYVVIGMRLNEKTSEVKLYQGHNFRCERYENLHGEVEEAVKKHVWLLDTLITEGKLKDRRQ